MLIFSLFCFFVDFSTFAFTRKVSLAAFKLKDLLSPKPLKLCNAATKAKFHQYTTSYYCYRRLVLLIVCSVFSGGANFHIGVATIFTALLSFLLFCVLSCVLFWGLSVSVKMLTFPHLLSLVKFHWLHLN